MGTKEWRQYMPEKLMIGAEAVGCAMHAYPVCFERVVDEVGTYRWGDKALAVVFYHINHVYYLEFLVFDITTVKHTCNY